MKRHRILVVDDKEDLADGVGLILQDHFTNVDVVYSAEAALDRVANRDYSIIFTDLRMPGLSGIELLEQVKQTSPATKVIVFTAYATVPDAVEAMKLGAYHYLTKPFDNDELALIAQRAANELDDEGELARLRTLHADREPFHGIYSRDRRMAHVFDTIRKVAPSTASVLVIGESGTGKELIARALHAESKRNKASFVAFNAAAVPEQLAEAELFGSRKGAFTGATQDRHGLFLEADKGTLFIDELSSMPLSLQGKLLRVIQEREVMPIGSPRPTPIDVRVIAALHEDPLQAVANGTLRSDLYYRLSVVKIALPPLRERIDDVPLLAEFFLDKHAALMETPRKRLSSRALRLLLCHEWPGNVRELQNVIERAALLADGDEIGPSVISTDGEPTSAPFLSDEVLNYEDAKRQTLEQFQRKYVERLLAECDGNISAASRRAGITRAALHRLLKRLDLTGGRGLATDS